MADYMVGMTGLTGIYYDGHTAMDITSAVGKEDADLTAAYQAVLAENQDVVMEVMKAVGSMMEMMTDQMAINNLRPQSYGEGVTYYKKGDTAV